MVNRRKPRESGFVRFIKDLWYGTSDMFSATYLSYEPPDKYDYNRGVSRIYDGPFDVPRTLNKTEGNMPLCSKKCDQCRQYKHLEHFFYSGCGIEYSTCKECRTNDTTGHRFWGGFTSFKKSRDYYDITIQEDENSSILTQGEKWVTWSEIAVTHIKNNVKNKPSTYSRQFKQQPWHYKSFAATEFERQQRQYFEKIWESGLDDCVPQLLLDGGNWESFWADYVLTSYSQIHIKKEKAHIKAKAAAN